MHERRKEHEHGDITAGESGDFTAEPFVDWDNPEDFEEDAPEGYYDDEDDESYVPGPDDPDYDLSEAAGYADWDPPEHRGLVPQWAVAAFAILMIIAILIPVLIRIS